MSSVAAVVVYASVYRTIGLVLAFIVAVGIVFYLLINIRQAKPEIGAEIELAPNREPYLSDEELEGPKLTQSLFWAVGSLAVIAVALPMYWLMEPGRQENAAGNFNRKFESRGAKLFETTENHGYNCAGCHGGMAAVGGTASYTLTKPDGTFDRQVLWKAPALNTVLLRYSREEVNYILTYGRPFSPMPAWGVKGGGPLTDQQLQNLIDYMESIQLTPEEAQAEAEEELAKMMDLQNDDGTAVYQSEGEALFNMGLTNGFAGGAYSCARCHTQGWAYASSPDDLENPAGGALGPSLTGDSPELQFPDPQQQVDFVTAGSNDGVRYGTHGQGSGKMPGFGTKPAEPALFWINKGKERPPGADGVSGMLTPEMVKAIVDYERSLD